MKMINEPIKNTGYSESMLALTPEEVGVISEELRPVLKSLKKKFDRLEDIRQSGEATEKQLDKWTILQEKISTIKQFIEEYEEANV
ncbi:MAG: hypothetical protein IKA04_06350 [Alistipes sp.]|nr:hypothetical protein [Alistipes sp.]